MLTRFSLVVVLLLVAGPCLAAEIVLRERCVPTGAVVRLGDVADIGAATPAERDALSNTPLTPAPAAGVARFLRAAEVRDLLALRGVSVAQLHFSGASLTSIGAAPTVPTAAAGRLGSATVQADSAAVRNAVESHVLAYLTAKTGSALWQVEAVGSEARLQQLAFATVDAAVSGGQTPWTGRQKFTIADRTGRNALPIFVQVKRLRQAVVAVRAIKRGDLISATDVELATVDRAIPTAAVTTLDGVLGQEARNAIAVGAVLTTGNLRAPIVVRRGELSTVIARAAGVSAKTLVVPQQDGSVGDLIVVEAGEKRSKRRFTARVTGYQQLEVFTAPTAASDLARN